MTPSPFVDDVAKIPFAPDEGGMLPIPTAPGLGLEVDWERVASRSTAVQGRSNAQGLAEC